MENQMSREGPTKHSIHTQVCTHTHIHTHMHTSMYTNGEQSLLEGLKGRRGLGGALLVFSPCSQDRRWQVAAGGGWVQPTEQSPTRGSTQVGSPRSQTPQVFPQKYRGGALFTNSARDPF